jgi:hypothetical protein
MRHVLASVVVADAKALGRVLLDGSEALHDTLPDRLERLVPGAAQGGMEAHALGRAVIDGNEDGDLAVLGGEGRGHVRAPLGVDGFRDDRAVVVARAAGRAHSRCSRQAVLAHQAAHPLLGAAQAWWRSRAQTLR